MKSLIVAVLLMLFSSASNLEVKHLDTPLNVKAIYLTASSAALRIDSIIPLKEKGLNAVVIDIKNLNGYIAYDSNLAEVEKYNTEKVVIPDIKGLIDKLHSNNIYAIARIPVFYDNALAGSAPNLSVRGRLSWLSLLVAALFNVQETSWLDPASIEVQDYNIAIAKEASALGFDEINFDYIRFPTEVKDMVFPVWNQQSSKREVISSFFKRIREELAGIKISVDVFGQTTSQKGDMGIGQVIEDAFAYFDFVCPMVYPSHYVDGFLGFDSPVDHPYEVVKYEMDSAKKRGKNIRPWLQDFTYKGVYQTEQVVAQIEAVKDSLGQDYSGYMLWNAYNNYHTDSLSH